MAVILTSVHAHLCHSDLVSTHQFKINLGKSPSSALWLSTNPQARLTVFVFPFKIHHYSFLIYLNCLISFHYLKCIFFLFFSSEITASVQFSRSVVSDSLWPHGLQHARLPCPSPTPRALTQTHAHRVSDAIQPSHPLSSPSPPTFNLSQHQGLF